MWNAWPVPVPWVAPSWVVRAACTPAGQLKLSPSKPAVLLGTLSRNTIAICPTGSVLFTSGAYVSAGPEPDGVYMKLPVSDMPFQSAVMVTGAFHVFAMYAAKQPPTTSGMMSGSTA